MKLEKSDILDNRITDQELNNMQSADIKQAAHDMIDRLDHLTWAELAYQATLKASIEQGLEEAKAGQLTSQDDIEKEFGLL